MDEYMTTTTNATATKQALLPEGWPRPKGYANGVMVSGRQIFVAGMIGRDAQGVFHTDDLAGQVRGGEVRPAPGGRDRGVAPAVLGAQPCGPDPTRHGPPAAGQLGLRCLVQVTAELGKAFQFPV